MSPHPMFVCGNEMLPPTSTRTHISTPSAHAAHPGIFWIFSVFRNGNSFLQLLLFGGCYVLSLLSRACVGIEVSVQLTLLVFHSASLLCLLHDRPAARSRPAALRAPVAARSRAIPPRSRPMLPCDPVTPRAPNPAGLLPGFRPRCKDFTMLPGFRYRCQDFGPASRISLLDAARM